MFDLKTLAPIRKIKVPIGGLDGIMYDPSVDRVILTNHSRPIGTAVAIDANTGVIAGTAELEDDTPVGAAGDGKHERNRLDPPGTATARPRASGSRARCAAGNVAP